MAKRNRLIAFVMAVAVIGVSLLSWKHLARSTKVEIAPSAVRTNAGSGTLQPIDTNGRKAIGNASAMEGAPQGARDWAKEQRDSKDYFEFISKALVAVEAGDGRAAYHIGDAVLRCFSLVRSAKQHSDFEERYNQQQTQWQLQNPQMPQWQKRHTEVAFQKCIHMAKESPFGKLPPLEENERYKNGYNSFQYWQDRAIELGDPVAKADRSVHLLFEADDGKASSENREKFERAESYLQDAIRTKDPRAVFMIGMTLISGQYSADPSRGVVLTLAACEMGLDCSGRAPLFPNDGCDVPEDARMPECGTPGDFRDNVQRDAGAARYAQVYARAQAVVEQMRREDWDALEPYMKIDGSLRKKYPPKD